jgi:hypothetical protein
MVFMTGLMRHAFSQCTWHQKVVARRAFIDMTPPDSASRGYGSKTGEDSDIKISHQMSEVGYITFKESIIYVFLANC